MMRGMHSEEQKCGMKVLMTVHDEIMGMEVLLTMKKEKVGGFESTSRTILESREWGMSGEENLTSNSNCRNNVKFTSYSTT